MKKVSPLETLKSFSVGDSMVISETDIKYVVLYTMIRRIEKTTDMRFSITIKGVKNGTLVHRDA